MTLRNRARNHRPARPSKPSRPRLPRGPQPSERGAVPASWPSRPLRAKDEQPPPHPVTPAAELPVESARNSAPEEHPPNGSSRGFPHSSGGEHAAPPLRYDRDKTRTLTVKDAAFRLNKSADTVYQWLRQGRLRGWQLGGPRCAVMVSEDSVEEVLAGSFGSNGAGHTG